MVGDVLNGRSLQTQPGRSLVDLDVGGAMGVAWAEPKFPGRQPCPKTRPGCASAAGSEVGLISPVQTRASCSLADEARPPVDRWHSSSSGEHRTHRSLSAT